MSRARLWCGRATARAGAVLWLAAGGLGAAGAADDTAAWFERASASVVTVFALDAAGATAAQGSGVWIDGGRIATNCHLLADAHGVRWEASTPARRGQARWVLRDPSRDLCLLEADPGVGAPAPRRPAGEAIAIGERVHALGNPLGFGLAPSRGLVSGFTDIDGERVIVSSAAQSPGSSGGALFDAKGRLIGITTGALTAGQNLNLVLPAAWIDELQRRGVPPAESSPPPGPEPDAFEQAQALTSAADWVRLETHARAWRQAQPSAARAALALAAAQFGQGRLDDAEASVREALRLDAHLADAWRQLGVVQRAAGRRAEAEQSLERALALQPASSAVYVVRAQWRLQDGLTEQALADAEQALAIEPDDARSWSILGDVRGRLGQADAAIRALRIALAINARDDAARQALAQLHARGGDADAAHRALVERGAAHADARTWIAVGAADFNRQRYAAAEAAFRKATEGAPELAQGWENLGRALSRLQRHDEAMTALDEALRRDPRGLDARLERSELRARRGDWRGAVDDAERATEIAPGDPMPWRALASRHVGAGDPRAALRAWQRLDALGQASADDLAVYGELLGTQGQRDAARAVFDRAEAIDPRHVPLLVNVAAFHGRAGDLERSQQYLERALENDPRNVNAHSSLGYVQLLRGATPQAVLTLERAVALDPMRANAWINLGHALLRHRQLGRAIDALEKALALSPDAADVRLYLAQALLGTRDARRAREQIDRVLARQPDLVPALSLAVIANLADGQVDAARTQYARLKGRDAAAAQRVRAQALAAGLGAASSLSP